MLSLWPILLIFVGVALLLLGSEVVVSRAQLLARRLNIPELIIGLTVVSFGSNLPEIMTAVKVGLAQQAGLSASGIVLGHVVGSSLANMTLVVGIAAIITTLRIDAAAYKRESIGMGIALTLMFLATLDGRVGAWEGVFLCASYIAYLLYVARVMARLTASDHFPERLKRILHILHLRPMHEEDALEEQIHHPPVVRHSFKVVLLDIAILVVGLFVVVSGADLIVVHGLDVARVLGMHTIVIGVLLGLFTSLPELVITLKALRRGADGLVLGNLMGGNILNPLFTLGISAIIAPIAIDPKVMFFEMPFLIVGTMIALILLRDRNDLDRMEGVALILFYLLFLFMSIFTFA